MVNSKWCTTVLILFLQLVPVHTDIKLTDYCSDKQVPWLQIDYTGTINHTVSGKTCQNWNSNNPHKSDYNYWYNDRNYCRNRDNPTGPWCFTTDTNTRWDLCDVPHCDEVRYCPEELTTLPNAPRNCQYTCHCRDKCKLDSVDGTCQFGCDHGWRGSKCQTDIDECSRNHNVCLPHGTCTNTPGSYHCQYSSGYTGLNCQTDIDECRNLNQCLPHGTCINTPGSYHCQCTTGYTGPNCQTDIDECRNLNPCLPHGTCISTPGSYHCQCTTGYTGLNCQTDIDECRNYNRCLPHGTCTNTPGSYHCQCTPGYTGLNCQTEVRCSTAIFRSPLKVNSTALTMDERYGATLIFSCESGYELIGNSLSTCQNNGTWSSVPTCKEVRCNTWNFRSPLKVNTTAMGERFGTTLTISCESGYELIGKSLSTCQNNGTWSSVPTCKVTAIFCTVTHVQYCRTEANCSCQYLCHCGEGDSCDPINGTCGRGGCLPGWTGKSCQYESGLTDEQCVPDNNSGILVTMGVVIAVLVAVCVVLCILLLRRRTTEIKGKGNENSTYTDLQMTQREDPNSHYSQLNINT